MVSIFIQMRDAGVSTVAGKCLPFHEPLTPQPHIPVKQRSNKRCVQTLTKEDIPLARGDDLFPV